MSKEASWKEAKHFFKVPPKAVIFKISHKKSETSQSLIVTVIMNADYKKQGSVSQAQLLLNE